MATVNFARREILCKIVYYGPGMGGKTTNLLSIHERVPEKMRGNMTSIATRQDRTLFFDLLPIEIGKIQDFTIRLQLYTVPGQVYYNASRKIVLKGVDGVVFVADSQIGKMDENIESLQNLDENLTEHGVKPGSIPLVLQFNKRDLSPLYSVEELNKALNKDNLAHFESIATTGHGVFNTLKAISAMVVKDIKKKISSADKQKKAEKPAEPKPAEAEAKPRVDDSKPAPAQEPAKVEPEKVAEQVQEKPEPVVEQSSAPPEPTPPPVAAEETEAPAPLQKPAINDDIDREEEKMEEPDSTEKKQGFWNKVSSIFRSQG